MKKINLFVFAIIALLGFGFSAKAAGNSVALKCDKTTIKIGESTNCTVSLNLVTSAKQASILLTTSEYLDVSNVKANTGWTYVSDSQKTGTYVFEATDKTNGVSTSGALFAFTLTLNSKASALGKDDTCGQLCIGSATINGNPVVEDNKGTCFTPTVVEEECVGEHCNPETGSFVNYAIIIASIVIAAAAVVIARKSTRFFRV